jgi:hypothetical protein
MWYVPCARPGATCDGRQRALHIGPHLRVHRAPCYTSGTAQIWGGNAGLACSHHALDVTRETVQRPLNAPSPHPPSWRCMPSPSACARRTGPSRRARAILHLLPSPHIPLDTVGAHTLDAVLTVCLHMRQVARQNARPGSASRPHPSRRPQNQTRRPYNGVR